MRDEEDEDEDEDEDDQKTAARRPTWNALACAAMVVDEMFSSYYMRARALLLRGVVRQSLLFLRLFIMGWNPFRQFEEERGRMNEEWNESAFNAREKAKRYE